MQNGSGPGPENMSDPPAPAGGETVPGPAGEHAGPGPAGEHAGPGQAGEHAGPGQAGEHAGPGQAGEQAGPGQAGEHAGPGSADEAVAGPSDGPDGPGIRASLEAIMLVADEPVSEVVIAQVLERPRAEVAGALRELAASYAAEQRGFDLREVAGGWRFYTREECAPVVERFVSDGQEVRLTQAALETLAVVAYRQPVSRARVSAVRGVNCDGVIRTLVLRGLVEEAGTDPETGAILFATTAYFLERLGLPSLDALPELAPFLPDHVDDEPDPGHEPAAS
jgi:segregation and condensation protein B